MAAQRTAPVLRHNRLSGGLALFQNGRTVSVASLLPSFLGLREARRKFDGRGWEVTLFSSSHVEQRGRSASEGSRGGAGKVRFHGGGRRGGRVRLLAGGRLAIKRKGGKKTLEKERREREAIAV